MNSRESPYALRLYRANENKNEYQATFMTLTDDNNIMCVNSMPFKTLDNDNIRYMIFPLDTKTRRLVLSKTEVLCVFAATNVDVHLLSTTMASTRLYPAFNVPNDTQVLYLCKGQSQEQCEKKLKELIFT